MQRLPVKLAMALLCATGVCSAGAAPARADPASGPAQVATHGFTDVTGAVGLHYDAGTGDDDAPMLHGMGYENGGLAFGDIDNDGRFELYVAHGQNGSGRLFAFNGRRFAPLANNRGIRPARMDRAGYFIDLDHDGWQDFVSIQSRRVQLFRNDGAGRFREATQQFGLRIGRDAHSMAAADYDGDGDLDLLFAHWDNTWSGTPTHYLWRNNARGRYEDVSRILPIRPVKRRFVKFAKEYSFTPTFADIDADGDPDILLAGDFRSSQVLRNDAGLRFVDTGGAVIDDDNGMGAAVADYDRDGDLDWFVSSIHDADNRTELGGTGNRLYRNIDGHGGVRGRHRVGGRADRGVGVGRVFRRLRQRRPRGSVRHQRLVRRIAPRKAPARPRTRASLEPTPRACSCPTATARSPSAHRRSASATRARAAASSAPTTTRTAGSTSVVRQPRRRPDRLPQCVYHRQSVARG